MDPKHGFAALLLDAHGVKPKPGASSDDEDPKVAMAEEILKAVKDEDASALAESMTAFFDHCADAKEDDEGKDEA